MTMTTKTVFRLAPPHPWQIQILVPHEGEAYLLLTADGVGEFSAPVPADKVDLVCQLIKAAGTAWDARDKAAPISPTLRDQITDIIEGKVSTDLHGDVTGAEAAADAILALRADTERKGQ